MMPVMSVVPMVHMVAMMPMMTMVMSKMVPGKDVMPMIHVG